MKASAAPSLAALIGAAVFLILPPAAAAQTSDVAPREIRAPLRAEGGGVPASLQEIYRRIGVYWEDQNARAIAQLVGGGRVFVVVQRRGERREISGPVAASQLQVLLQEMFGDTQALAVRFPLFTAYDPRGTTSYAVGELEWFDGRDSDPRVDRLFVSARKNDGGRWVLNEIRLTHD